MNILIAYATKYGSTKEIAERVAQILRRKGLAVDIKEADSVSSLQPYDTVILGSSVYFDNWLPAAQELLESFQDELSSKLVWLFSSGMTAQVGPRGWRFPEALHPLVKKIKPQSTVLFGGKVDAEQLSLDDWLINPSVRVAAGDYRDWREIEAWATTIAHGLETKSVAVHT